MSRPRGRSRAGGEGPSPGGLTQPGSSEENLYKAVLRASEGKKGTRSALSLPPLPRSKVPFPGAAEPPRSASGPLPGARRGEQRPVGRRVRPGRCRAFPRGGGGFSLIRVDPAGGGGGG